MPGSTEPVRAGVMIFPSTLNMTFMEPTSSIYFRWTPSSHSTWA